MAKKKKYTKIEFPFRLREYGKALFFGKNNSIPKSLTKDVVSKHHKGVGWITTLEIEQWFIDKEPWRFREYIVKEEEDGTISST